MELETVRKIEEAVTDILKESDMDLMTEFKVRLTASCRLGMDLSSAEHKKVVRRVVESFLLSTSDSEEPVGEWNVREETREKAEVAGKELATIKVKKEVDGDNDRLIFKLSDKRTVVVNGFRGKTYVSIRENFQTNGKPVARGMHLTTDQWSNIKQNIPAIEEAIRKLQSKVRSEHVAEQNGDESNAELKCNEFVPIETTRFDGRNYSLWASQMGLFLKQLNLSYVLVDPCPSSSLGPEANTNGHTEAKAAIQKWMSDDYLCRHHLLSSLSDQLYHQYATKCKSAKELWDELTLIYCHEEFETKRSHVRKYMEYQMVEDKSVLEQVQEFNNIAGTLVATGIYLDENFHVSATISKLPPSWKDFCIKLMAEEYLPGWLLIERVGVEEESRTRGTKEGMTQWSTLHVAWNAGRDTREMQTPQIHGRVMYCKDCGRRGHVAKFCRAKKSGMESKEMPNNASNPGCTEVNMAGKT